MRIATIPLYHVVIPLDYTFWPSWIPGYPRIHDQFTPARSVADGGVEGYAARTMTGPERRGHGDLPGRSLPGANPTDIDRIQSFLEQA